MNNNPYKFVGLDRESPVDIIFFGVDLYNFGAAVVSGKGIGQAAIDLGISTIGLASPVPGMGLAIKAGRGVKAASQVTKGIPRSKSLRTVGDLPENIEDIVANPNLLSGKTAAQVKQIIGKTQGWKNATLGKGAHRGQGWALREYSTKGQPIGILEVAIMVLIRIGE